MSTSNSHEAPTSAPPPRPHLRIAEELHERKERNRLISLLSNGALSLRRRVQLARDVVAGSAVVRRLACWWSRLRGWLRPAASLIKRSGVALPVLLAADRRVQRGAHMAVRAVGRFAREALYLSSDALTWLLWRTGDLGQNVARRYGFFIERVELTVERLVAHAARGLHYLHADQLYVQVLHALAGGVVIARQLAVFAPPQWRLAVGAVSLLIAGGAVRTQLVAGWRWLVNRVQTLLPDAAPGLTLATPEPARSKTPSGRNQRTRPAHRRPKRRR